MTMMWTRRHLMALALPLCLGFTALATAQPVWPDKPIRVVLPYPPGGPSDIVMRLAAEKMQAALTQPIVIEHKPGAGGNLGTAEERLQVRVLDLVAAGRDGEEGLGIPQDGRDVAPDLPQAPRRARR